MSEKATAQPGRPRRPNGRVVLGLLLIGTGRTAGFAQFGASTEAFLASLAPCLGLLIVLAGTLAWAGHPGRGLALFLYTLCSLLAPCVIGDLFCRLWDRRQNWALYANVLNCAQWLMLAVLILLISAASFAVRLGVSPQQAAGIAAPILAVYVAWFHWFAARHALQVSRARALAVMLAVVFGTTALLYGPEYVAGDKSSDLFAGPRTAQPAGTH